MLLELCHLRILLSAPDFSGRSRLAGLSRLASLSRIKGLEELEELKSLNQLDVASMENVPRTTQEERSDESG